MRLFRTMLLLVAIAGLIGLGFWVARSWYKVPEKVKTEQDATVVLEKIKNVAKLVTVEGYYSELYNYKDYYAYDWWIFRKKAIVRVKAKVSAGFDLSGLSYEVLPEQNLIVIRHIPDTAQIISIDHQLDYYDISEGTFNSFSEADYNKINKDARAFIERKALESDLMRRAEEQGIGMLEVIRFMAESAGWRVQMGDEVLLPVEPAN